MISPLPASSAADFAPAFLPTKAAWPLDARDIGLQLVGRVTGEDPIARACELESAGADALALDAATVLDLGARGLAALRASCALPLLLDCRGARPVTTAVFPPEARVRTGDNFVLARAPSDCDGSLPALLCSDPHAVAGLEAGAYIWLGHSLGARVIERRFGTATLVVTACPPQGKRLKPGKVIRLPDAAHAPAALSEAETRAISLGARAIEHLLLPAGDADRVRQQLAQLLRHGGRRRSTGPLLRVDGRAALTRLPRWLDATTGPRPAGVLFGHHGLALELGAGPWAMLAPQAAALCAAAEVPLLGELDAAARGLPRNPGEEAELLMRHTGHRALLLPALDASQPLLENLVRALAGGTMAAPWLS